MTTLDISNPGVHAAALRTALNNASRYVPEFVYEGVLIPPAIMRLMPSAGMMVEGVMFAADHPTIDGDFTGWMFDASGCTEFDLRNVGWVAGDLRFEHKKYTPQKNFELLERLRFPHLFGTGQTFALRGLNLDELVIPNLSYVGNSFYIESGSLPSVPLTLPLRRVGSNCYFRHMHGTTAVNLPSLEFVSGNIQIQENPDIESIDLSGLHTVWSTIYLNFSPNLTSISIGSLTQFNSSFYANDNNLPEGVIDHILEVLASLDGNDGRSYWNSYVDLRGNVPPSGAGLTSISTINGRGGTVDVDD